jgi:Mn2+/Fe2+ NRAMP family transporter
MADTTKDDRPARASNAKRLGLLRLIGPGLITGASDDDPSGIGTYSQAGAQFGFAISWTMLFTYPLMVAIQQISARVGRITGKGLAGNLRQHYPNWLLRSIVALLFLANTINIGADLGAMADALKLLIGGPALMYVILFGLICAILQVFMTYRRYVTVLKWLTLTLFAYFGTVLTVTPASGPRWLPCSAPRSVPICSSGTRHKKPRTLGPIPSARRLCGRRGKARTRSSESDWTRMWEWRFQTSWRSQS